jgi:hypothetical protein
MSERAEIFDLARACGDAGYETLRARLASLGPGTASEYAHALVSGFVDGTLDWPAGARSFAAVWERLFEDGWAPFEIERLVRDAAAIARWVWLPRWLLLSQDEDLLLFGRAAELLDAVAVGAPPKRDYALGIVAHDIRDTAWVALSNEGKPPPWDRARTLADHAERIGARELSAYLRRMASYGLVGRVDESGARARAVDVHRCDPPPRYELARRGQSWEVTYPSGARLTIGRHDGAMRATNARA